VLKAALGEGRSSANPPVDAASDVWRRVDIRAAGPDEGATVRLEFTSIGRLARAERVFGDVERAIVDQVVADAIHNPADDAVGGALFELLVPQELKAELGSGENLQLLVGPAEADLPWEMLRPRRDDHEQQVPLALRVGLLRQFRETEELRFAARRASGNNVLVIGNPPSGDLPTLSGAAAEAQQVELAFSRVSATSSEHGDHGWTVKSIIWPGADDETAVRRPTPKPADALYALLNGDWRVIHIAAHGEFGTNPAGTGVVLGSMHLTANVFSKLAVVPDLVMLNACHLGRVGAGLPLSGANRAAASVARALVRLGVRAVVVAGWAVDDRAASDFATQLYTDMLAGADFGNAVTSARETAWSTASGALTWGAYQCYGDPGFRLSPRGATHAGSLPTTKGELRRRVQLLQARASDQGRSAVTDGLQLSTRLRDDLAELEERAEALGAWDVMADLAGAWGEVLEFDRAIALYQAALQRGGSAVPIRAAEQIGNLQVREATRLHRSGEHERVASYVEDAERWLSRALDLGESGERLALLGSYHKKRATMTDGAQRREHLRTAMTFYERANARSSASYYELNVRQLAAVSRLDAQRAGLADETVPKLETTDLETAAARKEADDGRPERAPDFWSRAERGDRLLTEALEVAYDAPDEARLDGMIECYLAAFRLRSSARERASVVDHIDDLARLVPADHPLAERLHAAAKGLDAWPNAVSPATGEEPT
jgi:CHAT domain